MKIALPLIFTFAATDVANAVSACTPGRIEALGLPADACSQPGTAADATIIIGGAILIAVGFWAFLAWITRPR